MKQLNQHFVIIGIFLGLLISCKPFQQSQEEANKAVVRRFDEALNNGTFNDLIDELLTPDFVRHCQASGDQQINSPEEYKRFNEQWVKTFPDLHVTEHFLVAEGDMVAGYCTFTGTQMESMGPFPATGKKMKSITIGFFRLEDGKIAEIWVEWDNMAILTQLGHLPPPEKSEE